MGVCVHRHFGATLYHGRLLLVSQIPRNCKLIGKGELSIKSTESSKDHIYRGNANNVSKLYLKCIYVRDRDKTLILSITFDLTLSAFEYF